MRSQPIGQLLIPALVVVSWGCSGPALDRSKAASILESQPWGSDQDVVVSSEQLSCGVANGLWDFYPGSHNSYQNWDETAQGRQLGLGRVIDAGSESQFVMELRSGFRVSVNVTGIAAAPTGGSDRKQIVATLAAQIAHPCFSSGLPFGKRGGPRVAR